MIAIGVLPALLLGAIMPASGADASLESAMAKLPTCGLQCALSLIPAACDNGLTNTTCICTNQDLRADMIACVQATCTPIDAIAVGGADADMCGNGHEPRTVDNMGALAIEVPAWFAVWIRTYSRWKTMGRYAADDYLIIAAGLLYTIFLVLGQYSNYMAFGRDIWTIPADRLTLALKLFYIDESFYIVILAMAKVSIVLFYLRIFPQRPFRIIASAVVGFVVSSNLVILAMQIFQCWPISYNWEGWKGDFRGPHRCLNVNMLTYTAAAFGIGQDLIILVLPLPLLWGLSVSWRNKVGIFLMFGLGIFILATSCTRLQYMIHFARSTNPTWDNTDALIWSGLEVAVSMLVTSLPAIRALLKDRWPAVFGGSPYRAGSGSANKGSVGKSTGRPVNWGGGHGSDGGGGHGSDGRGGFGFASPTRARSRNRNAALSLFTKDGDFNTLNESQLELGDRGGGGGVHTRIGTENESASVEERTHGSTDSGIRVQTTTTTVVDPSPERGPGWPYRP